ncbi:MAG: hypothetical protein WCK89_19030, partial [bacterium]
DGVSKGAVSSYTFTNVTANHSIAAAFSNAPAPVQAGTAISVNFDAQSSTPPVTAGGLAGVVAVSNWNNVAAISNLTFPTNPTNTFHDSAGVDVPGFSISLSTASGNSWNTGGTPDQLLYGDWALSGGGTIALSGIPYPNYEVYVYFMGFSGDDTVDYIIGNVTNTLVEAGGFPWSFTSFVQNQNYVKFAGLTGSSKVLTVTGVSGWEYGVSAFQIVGVVVTPPALMMASGDAGGLDLTWPDTFTGRLLWSPTLGPGADWKPVQEAPAHVGGYYKFTVIPGAGTAFFGLGP